jgi:histone acetyltransferase
MFSLNLNNGKAEKKRREEEMHNRFRNRDLKLLLVSAADPSTDSMFLLRLKCLFQRQLAKMPKDYILRQLFDRKHICLALVDRSGSIVGAICYRPFLKNSFIEIVFLAVDYDYQVRGMGSFMMDLFKENAKLEMLDFREEESVLGVSAYRNKTIDSLDYFWGTEHVGKKSPLYLMTYADNFAIGYFKKQGFSTNIKFGGWIGHIKDYDGGTLVECKLLWELNYLKKEDIIERIRNKICEDMKEINEAHVVRKITDYSKIRRLSDIPGVGAVGEEEAGEAEGYDHMSRLIGFLIADLRSNTSAWPFLKPVNPAEVPDYYEHIRNPMDLGTIASKLMDGRYQSMPAFIDDVHLMLDNCFKYNGKDTQYYKCAQSMLEYFNKKLDFYRHVIDRYRLV